MPGKDIDKLFRDGLRDLKPAYNRGYWESLSDKLENSPPVLRRKRLYQYAYGAAAAIVIAISFFYWQAITNSKEVSPMQPASMAHDIPAHALHANISTNNNIGDKVNKANKNVLNASLAVKSGPAENMGKHKHQISQHANIASYNFSNANRGNTGGNALNNTTNSKGNIQPEIANSITATDAKTTTNSAKTLIMQEHINTFPAKENIGPLSALNPIATPEKVKTGDAGLWKGINYRFWDNPAYTGEDGKLNISMQDRVEYVKQDPNSLETDYYSVDGRINKTNLSIGTWFGRGITPYEIQATGGVAMAYKINIDQNTSLSIGASGVLNSDGLSYGSLFYWDHAFSVDGGLWFSHKDVYASFAIQNINQPSFGYDEGINELLYRVYQTTAGYVFHLPLNLSIMPRGEVDYSDGILTGQGQLITSWKGNLMLGMGINNINFNSKNADYYTVYAGYQIKNRVRLFTSYGRDKELETLGHIHRNIIESGVKILFF